jgi:DNA-binding PucR family transcriptional regulator
MSTTARWERPSPRIRHLIRQAAEMLIAAPEGVFDEVDAVTIADADPAVAADPALVLAIRRANRANLMHWAQANVTDPGAPVPPNLGPVTVGIARDLVRRGYDQTSLDAYRIGQNAAWRAWMALAFTLTSDPAELAELLDVTARSIFGFVDATIAGIAAEVERERERLTSGTHAERLEVVALLLEGAPIRADRASLRLQYDLDRTHAAAVIFGDVAEPDHGALEAGAELLARAAQAQRPFTVVASAAALWAWVPIADPARGLDLDVVRSALAALPGVRIAVGPTLPGIEGFRRSHLDALATQRLLQRVPEDVRVATYDEVQVVALATQDEQRADEFVRRTLGPLATAAPELRETLRAYLHEGSNTSQTARVLFAHRNTILARLERAEQLLPAPLAGRLLQVALALEIARWSGPR